MKVEQIFISDSGKKFYDAESCALHDKIQKNNKKIEKLYSVKEELQNTCTHSHLTVRAESDTGNWCKSDDSYWYSGSCDVCGKSFTFDQSERSILRAAYNSSDPRHTTVKKPYE